MVHYAKIVSLEGMLQYMCSIKVRRHISFFPSYIYRKTMLRLSIASLINITLSKLGSTLKDKNVFPGEQVFPSGDDQHWERRHSWKLDAPK